MDEEMKMIEKNQTLEFVKKPKGKDVVGLK